MLILKLTNFLNNGEKLEKKTSEIVGIQEIFCAKMFSGKMKNLQLGVVVELLLMLRHSNDIVSDWEMMFLFLVKYSPDFAWSGDTT